MANEAVIIELIEGGNPINFTIANATAVPKGTLMEITTPRTVLKTAADNDEFIGIIAHEKVASDGSTTISCWTKGIFDLRGSAAINCGEIVSISGANTVSKVAAADLLQSCVGTALETTGGAETIAVFVGGAF